MCFKYTMFMFIYFPSFFFLKKQQHPAQVKRNKLKEDFYDLFLSVYIQDITI